VWVSLAPAISRCLKARLYGWLPLSNAYGIFFRCNTIHNQTLTAFSFLTIQPKPIGISVFGILSAKELIYHATDLVLNITSPFEKHKQPNLLAVSF
jgi:hypothetical protein